MKHPEVKKKLDYLAVLEGHVKFFDDALMKAKLKPKMTYEEFIRFNGVCNELNLKWIAIRSTLEDEQKKESEIAKPLAVMVEHLRVTHKELIAVMGEVELIDKGTAAINFIWITFILTLLALIHIVAKAI